jgi:hypothetical protein
MDNLNKEMQAAVGRVLGINSLILYDLNNNSIRFAYQRHICSSLKEIPGKDKFAKIWNSIILTMSLWKSWEIHIQNSRYPHAWFGCVQADDQWLIAGEGTPPYVIFDSYTPDKIKHFEKFKTVAIDTFPFNLSDLQQQMNLRNLIVTQALFEEDNCIVWRLYNGPYV